MIITGAVYISQLLNVTHIIQVLDITYNDIGDEGMAVISKALQYNKLLTTLMVEQCGLSVKGTVASGNYVLMFHNKFRLLNTLYEFIYKIYVPQTFVCKQF